MALSDSAVGRTSPPSETVTAASTTESKAFHVTASSRSRGSRKVWIFSIPGAEDDRLLGEGIQGLKAFREVWPHLTNTTKAPTVNIVYAFLKSSRTHSGLFTLEGDYWLVTTQTGTNEVKIDHRTVKSIGPGQSQDLSGIEGEVTTQTGPDAVRCQISVTELDESKHTYKWTHKISWIGDPEGKEFSSIPKLKQEVDKIMRQARVSQRAFEGGPSANTLLLLRKNTGAGTSELQFDNEGWVIIAEREDKIWRASNNNRAGAIESR